MSRPTPTIVHHPSLPWTASPSPGVSRRRLEHSGPPEAGRVTSVVRFDPGRRFSHHPHPDGEEIFVLEGTFSDHTGDHHAGTWLLNPEGFEHAPFTDEGCVLFVKLRQHPGPREPVCVDSTTATWQPHPTVGGVEVLPLYRDDRYPERVYLLRIGAGTTLSEVRFPRGEEILVLDGVLVDEHGEHPAGTWLRFPPGSSHQAHTEVGCRLYVKRDHLP